VVSYQGASAGTDTTSVVQNSSITTTGTGDAESSSYNRQGSTATTNATVTNGVLGTDQYAAADGLLAYAQASQTAGITADSGTAQTGSIDAAGTYSSTVSAMNFGSLNATQNTVSGSSQSSQTTSITGSDGSAMTQSGDANGNMASTLSDMFSGAISATQSASALGLALGGTSANQATSIVSTIQGSATTTATDASGNTTDVGGSIQAGSIGLTQSADTLTPGIASANQNGSVSSDFAYATSNAVTGSAENAGSVDWALNGTLMITSNNVVASGSTASVAQALTITGDAGSAQSSALNNNLLGDSAITWSTGTGLNQIDVSSQSASATTNTAIAGQTTLINVTGTGEAATSGANRWGDSATTNATVSNGIINATQNAAGNGFLGTADSDQTTTITGAQGAGSAVASDSLGLSVFVGSEMQDSTTLGSVTTQQNSFVNSVGNANAAQTSTITSDTTGSTAGSGIEWYGNNANLNGTYSGGGSLSSTNSVAASAATGNVTATQSSTVINNAGYGNVTTVAVSNLSGSRSITSSSGTGVNQIAVTNQQVYAGDLFTNASQTTLVNVTVDGIATTGSVNGSGVYADTTSTVTAGTISATQSSGTGSATATQTTAISGSDGSAVTQSGDLNANTAFTRSDMISGSIAATQVSTALGLPVGGTSAVQITSIITTLQGSATTGATDSLGYSSDVGAALILNGSMTGYAQTADTNSVAGSSSAQIGTVSGDNAYTTSNAATLTGEQAGTTNYALNGTLTMNANNAVATGTTASVSQSLNITGDSGSAQSNAYNSAGESAITWSSGTGLNQITLGSQSATATTATSGASQSTRINVTGSGEALSSASDRQGDTALINASVMNGTIALASQSATGDGILGIAQSSQSVNIPLTSDSAYTRTYASNYVTNVSIDDSIVSGNMAASSSSWSSNNQSYAQLVRVTTGTANVQLLAANLTGTSTLSSNAATVVATSSADPTARIVNIV
jgi:trimeric autotransporter adhesin